MMSGMQSVPVGDVGMVSGLFVITLGVMFGRFAVVGGGMLVVFGGFVIHRSFLFFAGSTRRTVHGCAAVHWDCSGPPVTV